MKPSPSSHTTSSAPGEPVTPTSPKSPQTSLTSVTLIPHRPKPIRSPGVDIQPGHVREKQFEQFGENLTPIRPPRKHKKVGLYKSGLSKSTPNLHSILSCSPRRSLIATTNHGGMFTITPTASNNLTRRPEASRFKGAYDDCVLPPPAGFNNRLYVDTHACYSNPTNHKVALLAAAYEGFSSLREPVEMVDARSSVKVNFSRSFYEVSFC